VDPDGSDKMTRIYADLDLHQVDPDLHQVDPDPQQCSDQDIKRI
jgi:hypothetical protein